MHPAYRDRDVQHSARARFFRDVEQPFELALDKGGGNRRMPNERPRAHRVVRADIVRREQLIEIESVLQDGLRRPVRARPLLIRIDQFRTVEAGSIGEPGQRLGREFQPRIGEQDEVGLRYALGNLLFGFRQAPDENSDAAVAPLVPGRTEEMQNPARMGLRAERGEQAVDLGRFRAPHVGEDMHHALGPIAARRRRSVSIGGRGGERKRTIRADGQNLLGADQPSRIGVDQGELDGVYPAEFGGQRKRDLERVLPGCLHPHLQVPPKGIRQHGAQREPFDGDADPDRVVRIGQPHRPAFGVDLAHTRQAADDVRSDESSGQRQSAQQVWRRRLERPADRRNRHEREQCRQRMIVPKRAGVFRSCL
jgi:hypothetical protein